MRIIGIRHRVKKTAEGEARPTQVVILENGKVTNLDLETETDELDFVLGRFPTSFRKVEKDEDISSTPKHHVKLRKLKDDEKLEEFHASQITKVGKVMEVADKIPATHEGLQSSDKVAMMLGGSGDNLAFALARRGQEIQSTVNRIPPFAFKLAREKASDEDAQLLTNMLSQSPSSFYEVGPRDLNLIWLRECLRSRVDAMKARIACEQRLRQHLIGAIFCSPEGKFPEGDIEKQFDDAKANDKISIALSSEEGKRERELVKACEALDIYTELFKPIVGLGPMIASRIIGAVIDIRRFETKAKLRAFCGVHLLGDGRFPRRRNNEVANWNGDCRQALFLLGDQFNRRPDSLWGKKLLWSKAKYRMTHPYPVLVVKNADKSETLYELREGEFTKSSKGYDIMVKDGDKVNLVTGLKGTLRYTNGHIHKMATWYTLGKFVESLFRDWWNLEKRTATPKTNPSTEIVSESQETASGDTVSEEAAA
jgi:hypothetical protein